MLRVRKLPTDKDWKERAVLVHTRYVIEANKKNTLVTEAEIIRFLVLAIAGEAGGLANMIKKDWRGDTVPKQKLADEMAGIRIYLEHLASHLDINLDAACISKIGVVEKRLAHL